MQQNHCLTRTRINKCPDRLINESRVNDKQTVKNILTLWSCRFVWIFVLYFYDFYCVLETLGILNMDGLLSHE